MNSLTRYMVTLSQKWWAVLLVFSLNFASFGILFSLEDQFEALTNVPTFDTQNDLTAELVLQQLPLYTGEARDAYLRFATFDFVFPLVAGIFVTVLWTLLMRLNTWRLPQQLLLWNVPLLVLLITLWDWLENVSFLMILSTGATPSPALINAALFFKRLKLTWLSLNGAVISGLILLLVLNVISRVLRRQSAPVSVKQGV